MNWQPADPARSWSRKPRPLCERFWEKVNVRGANDCWPWQGAIGGHGYGNITDGNGSTLRAHRVSYHLHNGEIPRGLVICHLCDHTWCVNPVHLYVGSQAMNLREMSKKGRSTFGVRSTSAKLSDAKVMVIRLASTAQICLARDFGVSPMTISLAKRSLTWKHLP